MIDSELLQVCIERLGKLIKHFVVDILCYRLKLLCQNRKYVSRK